MLTDIILLIAVNAIAAVTYPIGKLSFEYGNPIFLTGVRMLIAGILLTAFELIRGQGKIQINRKFILLLLALSFFNVFFTNCLQFWALNYTSSGKAIFIFNMSPFIAAVLSYFLYSEKMSVKKVIALIIAFLGFLPILLSSAQADPLTKAYLPYGLAELALFIGAVASVIGWLIMKQFLQETNCSFILANGLSMIIGGIIFFPVSWLTEGSSWNHISNLSAAAGLLAVMIIANNIINYNAYAFFLKRISATLLFLLSFTVPLFTLFFGWLFLGEKIGVSFLLSIIIVGLGLILYCQEEARLNEIPPVQK